MATNVIQRATDGTFQEVQVAQMSDISGVTVTATNGSGATIAANKAVNLYDNSGVLTMRLADSSSVNRKVSGFTTGSVANGATGTVQLSGVMSGFSGLVAANADLPVFSDQSTQGAITTTVPSGTGNYQQLVGYCAGAGKLNVSLEIPIKLA